MKNKVKEFVAVFPSDVQKELPVFYSFFRKTSKKANQKIEFGGNFLVTKSLSHGSDTYFKFGTYKPLSKFIKNKYIK